MGTGIANARSVQWGQSTPATQAVAGMLRTRSAGTRKRRAKTKRAAPKKKRAAARRGGKKARLVKGSAAAKRYMAKIRRMRKRA